MTYDEITLFSRFLQDKGMRHNYGWFYNNHRFDKRSLEAFLEQADAEDAILSAFDICGAPNTIYDPKFWQALHEKWMKKLQEFRDNGNSLEPQAVRCSHCGRLLPQSAFALNTKGQLHKHCKECESGDWDRRRKEEEAAARERDEKERLLEEIAEQHREENESILSEIAEKQDGPGQKPADDSASKYLLKLGEYDATMHYKPEVKKIVFNAILSAYIHTAGLTKCYLETKRDGRQFLIFNNSEGANVTWISTKTSRLAQVCSAAHCRQISDYFHLSVGELYYLHVTKNLSKMQGTINIEVKQVHTREEYAAIAARREEVQKAGRPVPGEDVPEYETPDTEAHVTAPLIDFSEEEPVQEPEPAPKKANVHMQTTVTKPAQRDASQSLMIPLTDRNPSDLLQQLVDRNHLTERDIAKFLYDRGWKLQEPVVVTTHKKFKA